MFHLKDNFTLNLLRSFGSSNNLFLSRSISSVAAYPLSNPLDPGPCLRAQSFHVGRICGRPDSQCVSGNYFVPDENVEDKGKCISFMLCVSHFLMTMLVIIKLDGVDPVDNRPSLD